MRLIDAEEMIKRLQEWNTKDDMDTDLFNFALHRILEQPTAYDVDEVVKQLNEKKENLGFIKTITDTSAYIKGINDAIEIVKERGQNIFIKIMNWIAKKLKKEEPQNSIHRIQINKVDCCENCGNKDYFVSEELGISRHRIRLCKECFKDLRDAINLVLKDDN